jgi:hypothetical protein
MTLVVSAGGTTLTIDSTGTPGSDKHTIDLTVAATDTLGELVAVIEAYANLTCTIGAGMQTDVPSIVLKTGTTNLVQTVATPILVDDDVTAANRFFTEEITNSITDLQTAIREDPACSTYATKSISFPNSLGSVACLAWIAANTSLTLGRTATVATIPQRTRLSHIYFPDASNAFATTTNLRGADYAGLSDAAKKVRIENAARAAASFVIKGNFAGQLNHNETTGLTLTEFYQFIDELAKYRSYGVIIDSYANIANTIMTGGLWSDGGSGFWDRTFTGTDDYHLLSWSPLINVGVDVGLTQDYTGRPIQLAPDIGAYEYEIRRKRVM